MANAYKPHVYHRKGETQRADEMNAVFSKKKQTFCIVLPVGAAHIGSSLAEMSDLLKHLTDMPAAAYNRR
jgi:hypothetical protein